MDHRNPLAKFSRYNVDGHLEYYLERKEPKLGSIEHAEWQSKMNEILGSADIIIGKQRHGPTGNVKVEFEAIYTKFKDAQKN